MINGLTTEEMRFELKDFTRITPDTPDDHVELFYMILAAAHDHERPSWSRREMFLFFEYLASGNDDRHIQFEELKALLNRGASSANDLMGRESDYDDYAEAS